MPDSVQEYDHVSGLVTGWGQTTSSGPFNNILQEVRVATITNSQCRRSDYYEEQVTENMICAEPTDGRDACSGFGGGPLAVQAQDGSYSQIGILSFGRGCANKGYPGVYTRVTSFLDWIQETITITPGGQVIMISGGLTEGSVGLSSVEIYDPSAPSVNRSCQITPNMPTSRSQTVAHGSLVCGGWNGHPRDCIELRDGAWQTAHTLNQKRVRSSSWDSSKGLVIMGGQRANTTTEILRDDLTSDPYFNITETRSFACSITDYDTDTVILTGGHPTYQTVERYDHSGFISRLPGLNQGRSGHACGSYTKDGKKVFQTFLIFSDHCWLKDISGGGGSLQ